MLDIPYESGNENSREGAERIAPFVKTARYRVYKFIQEHPRCCDRDIVLMLGMNGNTVRPRRVELERAGLIKPVGLTKTPDKDADATAWEATGEPYPDPWPTTDFTFAKVRSERPTPVQFHKAVMELESFPLSDETSKVVNWLRSQSR